VSALAVATTTGSGNDRATAGAEPVRLAFVNNMSEGAVRQTERLFARLFDAASSGLEIEVRPYRPLSLDPSGELPFGYTPLEELFEHGADAVVVTGAEPLCQHLPDEGSWGDIRRLLEWIETEERPAFLSCLAAHAALLVYDGIERQRLPAKCSGVFPQQVVRHHLLGHGLPQTVAMPHSRYNDVPVDRLLGAGYEPVLHSPEVGWTIAARRVGGSLLVLAQGHPEYSGTTLVREYRRDVKRYLERSRDELPVLPRRCVEGPKAVTLRRFHERLSSVSRSPALMSEFPIDLRALHARAPWAGPAGRLVHNWLADVTRTRGGTPAPAPRARRGRLGRRAH
jgi:homoserine O-succinyltransferase